MAFKVLLAQTSPDRLFHLLIYDTITQSKRHEHWLVVSHFKLFRPLGINMYWRSLFLFKSVLPFICMLSLSLAYILSSPSSHAQQTNIPFVAQAPVPFSEANLWQQISVT